MMFFGGVAQAIEDYAGLHSRDPLYRINFEYLRHVPGEIQNNSDVAALSRKRSPATAAQNWRAIFTSKRDGRNYVVYVAGKNDSDGDLTEVRSVGGVERAAAVVEADIAPNGMFERMLKAGAVDILIGRFGDLGEFD